MRFTLRTLSLQLNDGSTLAGLQVIVQPDAEGANLLEEGSVSTGAAVAVAGELVTSPGGKQKVRPPDACIPEELTMAMRAAPTRAALAAIQGSAQHAPDFALHAFRRPHSMERLQVRCGPL